LKIQGTEIGAADPSGLVWAFTSKTRIIKKIIASVLFMIYFL